MDTKEATHASKPPASSGQGALYGLIAEFDTPGALIKAARKVRAAGYSQFDSYSPFPVHGIDEAMGIKRTILPLVIFGGGLTGLVGGLFLQWWCNAYNWPWNVAGKPSWSIPANIPIGFETTILLSVLTSFFGMWIMNNLPQVWHPFFRLDRFLKVTDDGFFLGIEATDKRFDATQTRVLLEGSGAVAIEACYHDPEPSNRRMPRWIYGFIVATTSLGLVPFALVLKSQSSKSPEPHYHIFADMDFQPKAKSDTAFDDFADGRANRGELPGTVAKGQLRTDDAYYRGLRSSDWLVDLPEQIVPSLKRLERGRERFNIYCSPCHGVDGQGQGAVPERVKALGGNWQARNLVDPAVGIPTIPNGQLFNTISNGFNTMMGYAPQIPVEDRWNIVLYVRALQRSQNAQCSDVPADLQQEVPACSGAQPATPVQQGSPGTPAQGVPAPGAPAQGTPPQGTPGAPAGTDQTQRDGVTKP